jgi:hypothetical protein
MLLARGGPRDREKALQLLESALETAQKLGMTALLEKVRELKLQAGG